MFTNYLLCSQPLQADSVNIIIKSSVRDRMLQDRIIHSQINLESILVGELK